MLSHKPATLSLLFLVVAATAVHAEAEPTPIFSEYFDYRDSHAMRHIWQRADRQTPNASHVELRWAFEPTVEIGASQKPDHSPVARLNNGIVYAALNPPIVDGFTLRAKVLLGNFSRTATVALLNEAGTEGYGIRWNSHGPQQFRGQGSIQIIKLAFDHPWNDWGAKMTAMTGIVESGHPIAGYAVTKVDSSKPKDLRAAQFDPVWQGFADVELSFDGTNRRLTGSVNGKELVTVVDDNFSSFARVYLRGNTSVFFDDLVVTTPSSEKSPNPAHAKPE